MSSNNLHPIRKSCQQYVEQIASAPQEKLESTSAQLIVVGCGDWQPINFYADTTGFRGKIYAEPTRAIYRELELISNLQFAGENMPSYLKRGRVSNALQSTWKVIRNRSLIGKQGSTTQNGGEFIFEAGRKCTFAHRMRNTEDRKSSLRALKGF
ncbi:hypothetical protein D9758_008941 [Tetrapyrgos nigripes]|uniref:Uncharacterized protein n=1 Tax=Tetrapyrgos nigripes TaxID=182062 RepID=A0A8H5LR62_9AGAR|nr:hypothetical protein D9758_008941 [Tetrapyrgos nigripes]